MDVTLVEKVRGCLLRNDRSTVILGFLLYNRLELSLAFRFSDCEIHLVEPCLVVLLGVDAVAGVRVDSDPYSVP